MSTLSSTRIIISLSNFFYSLPAYLSTNHNLISDFFITTLTSTTMEGAHNTPTPNSNRSHHHPYNGNHSGGGGGREDCWSEGATATLIDSWGDRYLQLSRGNLRQKDWKEVADAVNSRQDAVKKPRKTDVQCKNRIDTIKKKYKLERSKPSPSKWPFYAQLDELIGTPKIKPPPPPLPPPPPPSSSAVNYTVRKLNPNPNHHNSAVIYSGGSSSKLRSNSSPFGSTGSSHDGVGVGDDEEEDDLMVDIGVGVGVSGGGDVRSRKSNGVAGNSGVNDDGEALRELAKAIVNFGEVYERIESSKQQQIMELERQRMEFTKDLEFQRMQMFMEAQLELEKTKRPKYAPGAGKKL